MLRETSTVACREPKKQIDMPDDAIRPKVTFVKKGESISTPNEEWGYFHEEAPEDGFVVAAGKVSLFVSETAIQEARVKGPEAFIPLGVFVKEDVPERDEDCDLVSHLASRVYTCGCESKGYAARVYSAAKHAEWERAHTNGRTSPVDWPDGWKGGRCKRCGSLIRVDIKENERHNGNRQEA